MLRKGNVAVFRLPAGSAPQGQSLGAWREQLWAGGLLLRSHAGLLVVELVGADGRVFGQSRVPENASLCVEKCADSSRGYALRLAHEDGRAAWVGLAFHDRNDAFDFGCALEEARRRREKPRAGRCASTRS